VTTPLLHSRVPNFDFFCTRGGRASSLAGADNDTLLGGVGQPHALNQPVLATAMQAMPAGAWGVGHIGAPPACRLQYRAAKAWCTVVQTPISQKILIVIGILGADLCNMNMRCVATRRAWCGGITLPKHGLIHSVKLTTQLDGPGITRLGTFVPQTVNQSVQSSASVANNSADPVHGPHRRAAIEVVQDPLIIPPPAAALPTLC